MKTAAATLYLLLSAGMLHAQYQPAPAPADTATKPSGKSPAKKVEKKVPEKPKIPGMEIARENGTFLGLEVANGKFKLSFYDAKKKPMPADVTRAAARWPNKRGPGDFRTILNREGDALIGVKPVVPPYIFNVYLTLLQGEGESETAVEHYVVQLRG